MSEHEPGFAWLRGNARMEPIPPKRCTPDLDGVNHRKRNKRIERTVNAVVLVAWLAAVAGLVIGVVR